MAPRWGWVAASVSAVLLWRLAAYYSPSPFVTIPDGLRLPFALLGVLFLVSSVWAWWARPSPWTAVFLLYGLGLGIHWGGALGVGGASLEMSLFWVYLAFTVLGDAALLHLALIYPQGRRTRKRLVALYAPAAVTLTRADRRPHAAGRPGTRRRTRTARGEPPVARGRDRLSGQAVHHRCREPSCRTSSADRGGRVFRERGRASGHRGSLARHAGSVESGAWSGAYYLGRRVGVSVGRTTAERAVARVDRCSSRSVIPSRRTTPRAARGRRPAASSPSGPAQPDGRVARRS